MLPHEDTSDDEIPRQRRRKPAPPVDLSTIFNGLRERKRQRTEVQRAVSDVARVGPLVSRVVVRCSGEGSDSDVFAGSLIWPSSSRAQVEQLIVLPSLCTGRPPGRRRQRLVPQRHPALK